MKSPAVIHYKCLDTFALQGVARSFGSGAAGVRLTSDGLARHVRPSQLAREAREEAAKTAELDELLAREEKCDTLIPHVTEAAQVMLPPPASSRGSMPSLVTIEMGLRKPTTWAVVLLTLGVTFGVGLARVASNAAATDPVAVSTAAAPRAESVAATHGARVESAVASTTSAPITIALTTIVGRRHHKHAAPADATLGASSEGTAAPAADKTDKKSDVDDKTDDGDEATAAAAAAARAHSELSNSL